MLLDFGEGVASSFVPLADEGIPLCFQVRGYLSPYKNHSFVFEGIVDAVVQAHIENGQSLHLLDFFVQFPPGLDAGHIPPLRQADEQNTVAEVVIESVFSGNFARRRHNENAPSPDETVLFELDQVLDVFFLELGLEENLLFLVHALENILLPLFHLLPECFQSFGRVEVDDHAIGHNSTQLCQEDSNGLHFYTKHFCLFFTEI